MSGHLAAEVLSAYLDEELVRRKSEYAEDHLSHCPDCRQRLDGLRRVVSRLHDVEAAVLPPYLSGQIPALISLEATPKSLVERFEARVQRLYLPQSPIPLAFGLVMALVMTVYVFSWAVQERKSGRFSVPNEKVPIESGPSEEVVLGSVLFVRRGSFWHQASLGKTSPSRRIAVSTEEGTRVVETMPGLTELLHESSGAVVAWQGEVVLLFLEGPSVSDSGGVGVNAGDR